MRSRPPHGRSWALPLEKGPDFRQRGTLSAFLFEALAAAEAGLTREELHAMLVAVPKFAERLARGRSPLNEALGRLRRGGRIRLVEGRYELVHRPRSRLEDQARQETV